MKRRIRIQAALILLLAFFRTSSLAAEEPAQDLREWSDKFRENLQQGILKFWIDHAIDRQNGGIVGWLNREGKAIPPGSKSLVQQARVVWTFSAAYRQFPEPVYKEVATHTLKFMREKMRDPSYGGYWWLVSDEGMPLDPRKHLYGESFAIYGLAEYARAFNDERSRKEALALFHLIDRKAHDDANSGYHEAYTMNWTPLLNDPTLGARGRKSMNTHIHLLESFTTLYLATHDASVRKRLEELLRICVEKIVDSEQGYARLYFTDDWQPSDSDRSSYGHDIELSWLLMETAEALGRPRDPDVLKASSALVEHTLRDGFDLRNGGVFDEGPAPGPATSKRKIWWVQAEALVGLLNAYQLTGKPATAGKREYRTRFEQQARYVFDNFVDKQYGEWYNTIEPNGKITGDKANEWKAPYHAGRACLEIVRRLAEKP